MKIYLAPLEGITGYTYRRALHQCFGGFDKYFIPFILPNQKGHLSTREKKDIAPENNEGMYAVPQILTKNVEDFIRTAETLQEYGYNEVNLNLGCPSKTVVTKGRGTLRNPALAREIRGGAPASKEEIRRFHDIMYNEYCEDLSGDRNILFRMKELWSYLIPMFTNNKKYAKKIKKTEKCVVYESVVRELFSCEQLIDSNDDSEKITGTL